MSLIMADMPHKRQRRSYVERLVELGIVQDPKQCRKKRQRKLGEPGDEGQSAERILYSKNDRHNSSDSASSDQSESDDDIRPPINKANNKIGKLNRNDSRIKHGNKGPSPELSAAEIGSLLLQAVDEGFSEGLKWLAENLEEVALDQEADGHDPSAEGTPLVPISSDSVAAMDSNLFKRVLKGIGLLPPNTEQETYWRIPSVLHFETIRKRREIILKAVNRELIVDVARNNKDTETVEERNNKSESSDDDDLFERLRKMRDENMENSLNKSSHRNKFQNHSKSGSRKRRRSVDLTDENSRGKMQKIDEVEENVDDDDILSFAKKTLQHTELPDTEDILLNLPRHSDDSDQDENDAIVMPSKRKKLRVVSDDESD